MSEGTTAIGQKDDAAVLDPATAASMIALLKGLLSRLGGGAAPVSSLAVTGNAASGAADSGNPVKIGGVYNTTLPTLTSSQRGDAQLDARGNLLARLQVLSAAATDAISNTSVGWATDGTQPGTGQRLLASAPYAFNGTAWDRMVKANAASRIASAAASVNATSAKGSAGNVFKVFGNNVKASVVYLKIYNKAAAPTVGTDVPVLTIPIAASGRFDIDIGGANGFYMGTGIAYGFTTDAADNGTTALAAGDILGFTLSYA